MSSSGGGSNGIGDGENFALGIVFPTNLLDQIMQMAILLTKLNTVKKNPYIFGFAKLTLKKDRKLN